MSRLGRLFLMPDNTPTSPGLPDQDALAKMPWLDLIALRNMTPNLTTRDQNYLAPYEHRAYARENSGTPYGAFEQAASTPFFTAAKMAQKSADAYGNNGRLIGRSRSDPSLREIGQGLLGVWEGMTK